MNYIFLFLYYNFLSIFSYESIKYNARCFECWEAIVTNSSASEEEKLFALKNIQKLEPGNITFGQSSQNSR